MIIKIEKVLKSWFKKIVTLLKPGNNVTPAIEQLNDFVNQEIKKQREDCLKCDCGCDNRCQTDKRKVLIQRGRV